jgi:2-haloacid dehalogenase
VDETLVVFDLGGVLIDWEPRRLYRRIFAEEAAMERFLAEVCTPAWNAELDRGRPFAEAVAELAARHPEHAAAIRAWHERWIEMIGGPIAGTVALLERLATRGTPLVALSNWSAETFPLVHRQEAFRFLDRFERIFLSGELGMIKPEPGIFEHLLAATGRPAERCFLIDDSAANIAAAGRLGFATHRFRSPELLAEDLRSRGLLD